MQVTREQLIEAIKELNFSGLASKPIELVGAYTGKFSELRNEFFSAMDTVTDENAKLLPKVVLDVNNALVESEEQAIEDSNLISETKLKSEPKKEEVEKIKRGFREGTISQLCYKILEHAGDKGMSYDEIEFEIKDKVKSVDLGRRIRRIFQYFILKRGWAVKKQNRFYITVE